MSTRSPPFSKTTNKSKQNVLDTIVQVYEGGSMLSFELLLFGSMFVITTLLLIIIVIFTFLFKFNGITTTATITKIEEKEKYADSSINKHIAYDYVYQYLDFNRRKQYGIIKKNTTHIEFNVGDTVEIIYIKYWPHKSLYKSQYKSLSFLPWMITIILCVLLLILFINLRGV